MDFILKFKVISYVPDLTTQNFETLGYKIPLNSHFINCLLASQWIHYETGMQFKVCSKYTSRWLHTLGNMGAMTKSVYLTPRQFAWELKNELNGNSRVAYLA